jgi:hypothetical protein
MARRAPAVVLTVGGPPRVNLMPRAAIERRAMRALLRRWGWALAATLVMVALIGAGAFAFRAIADQRLAAAESHTTDLINQVSALQPVRQKLSMQSDLAAFRADAMATDVAWTDVLASVAAVVPSGLGIADFDLAPGRVPVGDDPRAEVGVEGTVVLTGTESTEMAELIRAVRAVPGVIDADGWSQTLTDELYRYDLRITVDQTVYTGAFADPSNASGGE